MAFRKTPLLPTLLSIPLSTLIAPASADQNSSDETAPTLLNAGDIVTQENVTPTPDTSGHSSNTTNSTITIPHCSSNNVIVDDKKSDASDITISIPGESTATAAPSPAGGVTYESSDHSTTVLPKSDGSVQLMTTITSATAPQDYTYTFTINDGSQFRTEEDGSAPLIGADGKWEGGIATPWAKDANGNKLPTSYSINENEVTQHISFDERTAFPVVADPWWAGNLIDHTEWADDLWEWSPTLKVYPTLWGRVADPIYGDPAWWETLEETDREGHPNPDTGSMYNQFLCHWDFVRIRAPRKESWNLDTQIPDRGYLGFLQNGCN